MMIPDAEPVDEQPVDEKPVDEQPPVEEPTPEPPAPKEKMWVRLKGSEAAPIEVDKDAAEVTLPMSEFEEIKPEVWENVTRENFSIVNDGQALAGNMAINRPFAFTNPGARWAWVDDALQVQRRKVE